MSKVKDNRRQKMFKREHELHLRSIILFMGHIVRSVVQRLMQDATLKTMRENTWLIVVDWAIKWLSMYAREQQSAFYAKAVDKNEQTDVVQLLPEAKQTSWQVFNLFVQR